MDSKIVGILLFLFMILGLTACDDDAPQQDKVTTIEMSVSSETGTYMAWGSDVPIDCMLVKEENDTEYKALEFSGITGFEYQKGYEYLLVIEKTILINPPADGSNVKYKLIDIQSKTEIKYQYIIKSEALNPFVLSSDGGKYEIPFTCKKRKYVSGELT